MKNVKPKAGYCNCCEPDDRIRQLFSNQTLITVCAGRKSIPLKPLSFPLSYSVVEGLEAFGG